MVPKRNTLTLCGHFMYSRNRLSNASLMLAQALARRGAHFKHLHGFDVIRTAKYHSLLGQQPNKLTGSPVMTCGWICPEWPSESLQVNSLVMRFGYLLCPMPLRCVRVSSRDQVDGHSSSLMIVTSAPVSTSDEKTLSSNFKTMVGLLLDIVSIQ